MGSITVRPAGPLTGTVTVGGAKNSVLKLMAATCLAEGTYVLRNVPHITDVICMSDLLTSRKSSETTPTFFPRPLHSGQAPRGSLNE